LRHHAEDVLAERGDVVASFDLEAPERGVLLHVEQFLELVRCIFERLARSAIVTEVSGLLSEDVTVVEGTPQCRTEENRAALIVGRCFQRVCSLQSVVRVADLERPMRLMRALGKELRQSRYPRGARRRQ
jgi:hypothetical protein